MRRVFGKAFVTVFPFVLLTGSASTVLGGFEPDGIKTGLHPVAPLNPFSLVGPGNAVTGHATEFKLLADEGYVPGQSDLALPSLGGSSGGYPTGGVGQFGNGLPNPGNELTNSLDRITSQQPILTLASAPLSILPAAESRNDQGGGQSAAVVPRDDDPVPLHPIWGTDPDFKHVRTEPGDPHDHQPHSLPFSDPPRGPSGPPLGPNDGGPVYAPAPPGYVLVLSGLLPCLALRRWRFSKKEDIARSTR